MKFTLLIPVGRFSYFVHACVQNVFETCGDVENLDLVFLTSKTVTPAIEMAFAEQAEHYPFRVLAAPFEAGSNHLQLLDWAIREGDLTDWVIVQHSDLFWQRHNWLAQISESVRPELAVLCVPCKSRFCIKRPKQQSESNIPIVGDFFGVYNRKRLVEKDLRFTWGVLGEDVKVSYLVNDAIQRGIIYQCGNKNLVEVGKQFMDGSQAMAWELTLHDPESIGHVLSFEWFYHVVAFFRIADSITRRGNTLRCDFPIDFFAYALYSYLTSFCIEREEVESVALPWSVFCGLARYYRQDVTAWEQIGEWLRTYSRAKHVIGMDDLGVDWVEFLGDRLPTRLVRFV